MRHRRWRRFVRLLKFSAAIDAAVLWALVTIGVAARLFWPDHYLADIAFPLAFIVLFLTLRWA